jgi:hypothetical protein
MSKDSYKHYIPEIKLSIERYTNNVPSDGYYYILQDSKIVGRHRKLVQAEAMFKEIVKKSGFKPKTDNAKRKTKSQLTTELYFDRGDIISAFRVH